LIHHPVDVDGVAFERQEIKRIGMPDAIAMRHRTLHFQHIFSGGCSAACYSYLWSEVLDANGFEAFEESGDIFDPETVRRLNDFLYSAGGSRDYDEAYRAISGAPSPEALFRKRGLIAAS
jgi:peptidyl-dipeptidase Dcp